MGKNDTAALIQVQDLGFLLCANHQHDDDLALDLYGSTDDGEIMVETVMVAGTFHNVTCLMTAKQLDNLSRYLELKDLPLPAHKEWANRFRSQAQRP